MRSRRGLPDSYASLTVSSSTEIRVATPEYFATMGIPLLQGRMLEPLDSVSGATGVYFSVAGLTSAVIGPFVDRIRGMRRFVSAEQLTRLSEEQIYSDRIVHADSSPAQRSVVTRWRELLRNRDAAPESLLTPWRKLAAGESVASLDSPLHRANRDVQLPGDRLIGKSGEQQTEDPHVGRVDARGPLVGQDQGDQGDLGVGVAPVRGHLVGDQHPHHLVGGPLHGDRLGSQVS